MSNQNTNNCTNPLKLTWKQNEWQYKVNKPEDQSGEYVDKQIADNLLEALTMLVEETDKYVKENIDNKRYLKEAIDKSHKAMKQAIK